MIELREDWHLIQEKTPHGKEMRTRFGRHAQGNQRIMYFSNVGINLLTVMGESGYGTHLTHQVRNNKVAIAIVEGSKEPMRTLKSKGRTVAT